MRNRQRPLKFIASDADGFPRSRRKAHRACVQCRRRKRRCTHGVSASRQLEIEAQSHEEICPPARNPSSPLANIQDGVIISPISSMGTVRENDQHLSPEACIDGEAWFVGDLDPEGAFLVAASPASSSRANRRHGDVGVWLSAKNAYTQLAAKKPTSSLMSCLDPFLSSVILPNLESQCLGVLPAPDDMKELLHIYLTNIHPMFPVLDLETYENMPTTSPERIILSQSICIAAALHQDATPYLRLPTVDSSFDFSRGLLDAINASVALGLAKDKLVLIQAFSLASLFTQFSGNRQESAELLSRAICHTYTIGIHHHCPSSMQKEQTLTRIFCCLYALDILTAAFLGRPMQFHRRDTNRDILSSIAAQDSCFQLLLRTILVLERVIELYQPAVNSTWKEEFPPFEDLLQEVDTSDIPLHFIATIEVLYHAAAILACRSASPDGVFPTSEAKLRQGFSAERITYIVGDEFHGKLCSSPIIPYSVALSLRVMYHSLQQSKSQIFQQRSRRHLITNCHILRELGDTFHSASLMADLGEHLVHKGDNPPTENEENTSDESSRLRNSTSRRNNADSVRENTILHDETQQGVEGTQFYPPDMDFFDPTSTLGIFDNFDFDFGTIGGMNNGSF